MLEQMVESKQNTGEGKRKSGFLLATSFVVASLLGGTTTYSLFAKDLGMNDEGLQLSALVAPVVETEKTAPPEIKTQPARQTAAAEQSTVITRRTAFASIEQNTKPPADMSGQKDVQAWVSGARLGKDNLNPTVRSDFAAQRGENIGDGISKVAVTEEKDIEPPTIVKKEVVKAPPTEKKKDITISTGVVNGKAVNLVKPLFPPAAKAVRASGSVNVQVVIDENGNVISASSVSGHPLLRQAAETAARASKFSPTLLSRQAVKVTGIIVYNFNAQ